MIYRVVRAVIGFALRLFYRIRLSRPLTSGDGPVILVGNHPNALIDPALIFVLTERHVTFLAKAPLFKMPVIGWILHGMRVLPVFRKQDDPSQMGKNEGTFDAATQALKNGGAIMLFPEGTSHDLPHLAELKTGAARIALRALASGAPVRIVPVGLTYAQKHLFNSEVRVEPGAEIDVAAYAPATPEQEPEAVRRLTEDIARGIASVTLNLEQWEDLPLIETAEELYAFRRAEPAADAERRRLFARGIQVFRAEQPQRYAALQDALLSFRDRLALVRAGPRDLALEYRHSQVLRFILTNVFVLGLGLPLFVIGVLLFWLPYQIPRVAAAAAKSPLEEQGTIKFLTAFVVGVAWWALLVAAAAWFMGVAGALLALIGTIPLALFTLYVRIRLGSVIEDVRVFFTLGHRGRLKARLLAQADTLAAEVDAVATEIRGRLDPLKAEAEAR